MHAQCILLTQNTDPIKREVAGRLYDISNNCIYKSVYGCDHVLCTRDLGMLFGVLINLIYICKYKKKKKLIND